MTKDFSKLLSRFRQFGGMRLIYEYARMGVLGTCLSQVIRCTLTGKSYKQAYPKILEKINSRILPFVSELPTRELPLTEQEYEERVWFCWLQGLDNSPNMVKTCLKSQQLIFGDKVTVVDFSNYQEWVTLPDFVVEKYRKGIIPGASFSDLLRLELLIKYGGTWIDSTVLATKPSVEGETDKKSPIEKIFQSDLFFYRYFNGKQVVGLSNWFLHSKPNNPVLMDVRDALYAYWKRYDCVLNYYMFHLFLDYSCKRYPVYTEKMPRLNSYNALILRDNLHKNYNEQKWSELTSHVWFHKLNYRQEDEALRNPNSFWSKINQDL